MRRVINEKSTENEIIINKNLDLEHRLISFTSQNIMTHQAEETLWFRLEGYTKWITDLEIQLWEKDDEVMSEWRKTQSILLELKSYENVDKTNWFEVEQL